MDEEPRLFGVILFICSELLFILLTLIAFVVILFKRREILSQMYLNARLGGNFQALGGFQDGERKQLIESKNIFFL
ncbi:Hypothetical protein FKW44_022586 [Caligus rogercresseyi]|uniref:Uncharacterized protein n=1 Tax=Caligus rogercresseyi TaxID=217165 RepID=A0A7T8GML9_CALRO|nr:Hypothetical protein FKW44_022586 [Caligus rogercresseyi]